MTGNTWGFCGCMQSQKCTLALQRCCLVSMDPMVQSHPGQCAEYHSISQNLSKGSHTWAHIWAVWLTACELRHVHLRASVSPSEDCYQQAQHGICGEVGMINACEACGVNAQEV